MFFESMDQSWRSLLASREQELREIENQVLRVKELAPAANLVMRAFQLPVTQVRVLVLGQDPYPTKGVACGLAFAVSTGVSLPQSLKNLMKELGEDLPGVSNEGDITAWSKQGVLLLNSALTTPVGASGKHELLWREFTKAVITELDSALEGKLVCLSLGEHAKKLSAAIKHGVVIQATHPSPLSASRGFFGSKIYSRVNQALSSKGLSPIDWSC
jgi:uracil-DNA glycosylase